MWKILAELNDHIDAAFKKKRTEVYLTPTVRKERSWADVPEDVRKEMLRVLGAPGAAEKYKLNQEQIDAVNELRGMYPEVLEEIKAEENKNKQVVEPTSTETLEDITNELNSLIGLDSVKEEVNTLINFIKVQKEREKQGLKSSKVSYHCVFTGSPGTGKTTVARIISRVYRHLGVLTKGHFVETDRAGLVAEYAGQTAVKVNQLVDSALDGILFIDEAYSLIGDGQDDYGREAVAALLKRMEDNRDRLVVIVAGYQKDMDDFIGANPGLKSRFNRYIQFPDYKPEELLRIFESLCAKSEYTVSPKVRKMLRDEFEKMYSKRDDKFGNGRTVRNMFEQTIENHSNRVIKLKKITKRKLTTLQSKDIPK